MDRTTGQKISKDAQNLNIASTNNTYGIEVEHSTQQQNTHFVVF
jgi:hypothetical protein